MLTPKETRQITDAIMNSAVATAERAYAEGCTSQQAIDIAAMVAYHAMLELGLTDKQSRTIAQIVHRSTVVLQNHS